MNTTTEPPQTTLRYREGTSDKVYQCEIKQAGDRFVVNFAYGRRGSTMNTGTKTNVPADYESAQRIYDKLVKGNKSKGYTEGEAGTPCQHSDNQPSGIISQGQANFQQHRDGIGLELAGGFIGVLGASSRSPGLWFRTTGRKSGAGERVDLNATGEYTRKVEAQPPRSEVSKVWSRNATVSIVWHESGRQAGRLYYQPGTPPPGIEEGGPKMKS
jgi:predicted DNA-binding WGR domain protein